MVWTAAKPSAMPGKTSILAPIGILAGGIIGAGMFSLPFVFVSSGALIGLIYLLLAAGAYTVIHLMYADIILRTPGRHRFAGYVARYLGAGPFWLSVLMVVIEMILVLTIYLLLSQGFSTLIIGAVSPLTAIAIFWILGSIAIFFNIKRLALSEGLVTLAMIGIIAVLFGFSLVYGGGVKNIPLIGQWGSFLLPLPAILFALSGRVAIPSVIDWFKSEQQVHPKAIKKAIVVGTVLPALVYALFVYGVMTLSGQVSADGVSGLLGVLPGQLLLLIGILGWLSLWSSYILVGLDIERTLAEDLRVPTFLRLVLVVFAPLLLYLLGIQNFLALISIVGGVFLSLEGIFVMAIWRRINKQNGKGGVLIPKTATPFLTAFLLIIFFGALVALAF